MGDAVSKFRPFSPRRAVELLEGAGVENACRLILDYAAAGLVVGYAVVIEFIEATGVRSDGSGEIPKGLWERIILEGAAEDVWIGGTVRLSSSSLIGGAPAVNITGIRFDVMDLHKLIWLQKGYGSAETSRPAVESLPISSEGMPDQNLKATPIEPKKAATGLRPHALVASVNEAAVALNCSRTTIYKMLGDGRLKRAPDGKRIDVASIKVAAGVA